MKGNDFVLDLIEYEELKQKAISSKAHGKENTTNGPTNNGPRKATEGKKSNMKTERNNSTNNENGQDIAKMIEDRKKKAESLVNLVEFDQEKRIYKIGSGRGNTIYTVSKPNGKVICSCDDYARNGDLVPCKHIMAVKLWNDNGNGKKDLKKESPFEDAIPELINPGTGEILDPKDLSQVVKQWRELKETIARLYAFKDDLENVIVSKVEKPEYSKTAHLQTDQGKLKIEFRENIVWNQDLLTQAVLLLEEKSLELFKIGYKPDLVRLKKFLDTTSTSEAMEKAKTLITQAKFSKPAKPSISLESR